MSKEKSKLQIATEQVEMLVKQTNQKLNELGDHAYCLNNVLSIIQNQFNKIRNLPPDTQREYQKVKEVCLEWKQYVEKIEQDYNAAQKAEKVGGSVFGGLGVSVAAMGPTAAMGIATTFGVASTGTAISSLSGAAATNAALAWLGGGTLATGGGGIAGGTALLALAGPVGWSIAGVSLVGSAVLFWLSMSEKKRLENIWLNISKRDQKSYEMAIVEIKERIKRITNETEKLNNAIVEIGSYGLDFSTMTEEQQYTLGSYVNLMFASSQLLVNPIMELQPNYSEKQYYDFLSNRNKIYENIPFLKDAIVELRSKEDLVIYFANLLYKVDTDKTDRKLLAKSFRKNKEFCKQMKINKNETDLEHLLDVANEALRHAYDKQQPV